MGSAELLGDLSALVLVKKSKRKTLLLSCVLISSIFSLSHFFIGADITCPNGEIHCTKSYIASGLAMIVKYTVTIGYAVIFVYATELLPTKIRATGLGFCIFVGRAGSMAAPLIAEYSKNFNIH